MVLRLNFLRNRKGFAIAFNWLFAIMVGVIILLFFVWFAIQNTDLFGKLTSQVVVEELDIAFSESKTGLVTSTILPFGKNVKMNFICNKDEGEERIYINDDDWYKIGGKTLKGKLVFSPEELEGSEFGLFTIGWNVPFRVTNFIFLDKKGARYDLGGMPDELRDKIPSFFDVSDVNGPIEFISGVSGDCSGGPKIYLTKDNDLRDYYGTICVDGVGKSFVGEAMIFAAIFSDEDNFECLYKKANEKAEQVGKILDKLNFNDVGCQSIDLPSALSAVNFANAGTIKEENDKLLREKTCEGIY